MSLGDLMNCCQSGICPDVPESLNSSAKDIIARGSSVDLKVRYSFDEILVLLQGIGFKLTDGVDATKVCRFVEWAEAGSLPRDAAKDKGWNPILHEALRNNPEFLELRERALPVVGGHSFANVRNTWRVSVVDRHLVLQRVSQHLQVVGMVMAQWMYQRHNRGETADGHECPSDWGREWIASVFCTVHGRRFKVMWHAVWLYILEAAGPIEAMCLNGCNKRRN
jgi:hypothetical protein